MNGMFYVVVEQGLASVVNARLALTLEMDPYFDGELYGSYNTFEEANEHANQVNL
jgi:hypothetical protein